MPRTVGRTAGATLVVGLALSLTGCAPPSQDASAEAPHETTPPSGADEHRAQDGERRARDDGRALAEGPPGSRSRPWSLSDGPFTRRFDAAPGEDGNGIVAVPGGLAAAGWMRTGDHVGLVLRFSPDGERWDWIPIPLRHVDRPALRVVGTDLAILTDETQEIPAWTVQDIESLVRAVPTGQSPPRVGAGWSRRPV